MKIENLSIESYMKIITINNSELKDSEKEKEIIKLFHPDLKVSKKESDDTIKHLAEIMSYDGGELIQRFIYEGNEYGFIPNLDDITTGEYIDLNEYIKDGKELHRIMAILYRPVIKSEGELYRIEEYEGSDKYCSIMKGVDFRVIVSALVFFSLLGKSLLSNSDIYIRKLEQQMKIKSRTYRKKVNLMKSLVGTICFWKRPMVSF